MNFNKLKKTLGYIKKKFLKKKEKTTKQKQQRERRRERDRK